MAVPNGSIAPSELFVVTGDELRSQDDTMIQSPRQVMAGISLARCQAEDPIVDTGGPKGQPRRVCLVTRWCIVSEIDERYTPSR